MGALRLIWIAATVVVLALLDGAVALHIQSDRNGALTIADQRNRAVVGLVQAHADNILDQAGLALNGLRFTLEHDPAAMQRGNPMILAAMETQRQQMNGVLGIFVFDANGNLINGAGPPSSSNISILDRNYFQHHLGNSSRQVFIDAPIRNRSTGEWVLPVSMRMDGHDGAFQGVILLGLRPAMFLDFYAGIMADQPGMIGLYYDPGIVIARYPGTIELTGRDIRSSPFMINAAQHHHGLWSGRSVLDGEEHIYAFDRSHQYPLLAASGLTHRDWQRESSRKTSQILSLAAFCNMLVLILSLSLYQQTRRRHLAMQALQQARDTLQIRVQERTADLENREAKLRTVFQVARDALIVADQNGIIQEFNPGAQALFGYGADEVIGRSINMLMPHDMAARHDAYMRAPQPNGVHAMGQGREIIGKTKDGRELSLEINVGRDLQVEGGIFVAMVRDISDRKRMEQHLTQLANTDSLTGLLNRRVFSQQLSLALAQDTEFCVLMIDADHFKQVNDVHGHPVGDLVLQTLATTMRQSVRSGDLISRLGGEEFAILLPGTNLEGGLQQSERLLGAIRDIRLELATNQSLGFTVSIGITQAKADDDVSTILNRADQALYQAKSGGRDRCCGQ